MSDRSPELTLPLSKLAIERLASEVPIEGIVEVIQGLLTATYAKADSPDWKSREAGVKLWLSYVIGLPVQRQEIVTHKLSTGPTLENLLRTPGAVETLLGFMLESPEARARMQLALDGRSGGPTPEVIDA